MENVNMGSIWAIAIVIIILLVALPIIMSAIQRAKNRRSGAPVEGGTGKDGEVARKLRHGGLSAALTAVVLILLVVANYAFGALAQSKRLYVDMTESKIYSVSDEADEIIKDVRQSTDRDFEFIFFTPFNEMENNSRLNQVYEYCLALEEKYDFVSIRYIDSLSNPEEAARFQNSEVPDLYTTDVVISNGEAWQAFKLDSFFTYDTEGNLFAFNAEYRICTALMQMTYQKLLVCFTVGHGEKTAGTTLATVFENAGYEVRDVDLSKEDVPKEARALVINAPVYDFQGAYDDVNEIDRVDKYLDGGGNVMVFEDPLSEANLGNLSEFLEEWGIKFVDSKVKDPENSLLADGTAVVSDYVFTGTGSGLTGDLRALDNPPKIVLKDVMPIEILWDSHNYVEVSTVLTTFDTAEAHSLLDDSITSTGVMPLMTVSTKTTIGENNESYYNYLVAVGTSSFTDDKYLDGNTFGNSDVIYEAIRAFAKKEVRVDLDFKVYENNALVVTAGEAFTITGVLTVVVPLLCCLAGEIVYLIRKRR